jgi:hypothetical protein
VWVYRVAAWALLSVVLALAAPYNDVMAYDFPARLGYWSSVNAGAIVIAALVRHVVVRRVVNETLWVLIAVALLQALILGPLIWLANIHVFGFHLQGMHWLAELTLIMLLIALCVALVRFEVARVRSLARRAIGEVLEEVQGAQPQQRPGFLERGEVPLEGPVQVVSADGHFLTVVTAEGTGRLRMRFRDALSELELLPGHRIHRSHWVAEEELLAIRPEGRRHVAILRSGMILPVSDGYLPRLRAAGFVAEDANGRRMGTGPSRIISAPMPMRPDSSGRSQNSPPV